MRKDEREDVKTIKAQHIADTNNPSSVNVMNRSLDSEPSWQPADHGEQQTCYCSDWGYPSKLHFGLQSNIFSFPGLIDLLFFGEQENKK